jgi:hypothetical protein
MDGGGAPLAAADDRTAPSSYVSVWKTSATPAYQSVPPLLVAFLNRVIAPYVVQMCASPKGILQSRVTVPACSPGLRGT